MLVAEIHGHVRPDVTNDEDYVSSSVFGQPWTSEFRPIVGHPETRLREQEFPRRFVCCQAMATAVPRQRYRAISVAIQRLLWHRRRGIRACETRIGMISQKPASSSLGAWRVWGTRLTTADYSLSNAAATSSAASSSLWSKRSTRESFPPEFSLSMSWDSQTSAHQSINHEQALAGC
jgi:hypothetical protein